MRGKAIAFLAVGVAVMFAATSVVSASVSLPMVGTQWAVRELFVSSSGKTRIATVHALTVPGGVEFAFPDATGSPAGYVSTMYDMYSVSLSTEDTLTATFEVVATSGSIVFVGNPNGGCSPSSPSLCPGNVRLFFQTVLPAKGGATCTGPGYNEYNYWWSNTDGGYYQFTNGGSSGSITLSVSLDPGKWSDLCGRYGTADSAAGAGFASAIAKVKVIGLSFGSGYFFSNGVGVDYDFGTASFRLTSYTIS